MCPNAVWKAELAAPNAFPLDPRSTACAPLCRFGPAWPTGRSGWSGSAAAAVGVAAGATRRIHLAPLQEEAAGAAEVPLPPQAPEVPLPPQTGVWQALAGELPQTELPAQPATSLLLDGFVHFVWLLCK